MEHLYEDAKGVVHACEGDRIVTPNPDTYVVWTQCGEDVPAGKSFKAKEEVTCVACKDFNS